MVLPYLFHDRIYVFLHNRPRHLTVFDRTMIAGCFVLPFSLSHFMIVAPAGWVLVERRHKPRGHNNSQFVLGKQLLFLYYTPVSSKKRMV